MRSTVRDRLFLRTALVACKDRQSRMVEVATGRFCSASMDFDVENRCMFTDDLIRYHCQLLRHRPSIHPSSYITIASTHCATRSTTSLHFTARNTARHSPNKLNMATPISQESSGPCSEQEQMNEMSRRFYYVRKREVRMFPGATTLLKMSIQKYMAKYEVEFMDDDQKLRVSLPLDVNREDSDKKFQLLMEMPDAMKKAKLFTFFRVDTIKELEKHVQMTEISILGLERRNTYTSQERQDLKDQRDLLAIHKAELAKQKQIQGE